MKINKSSNNKKIIILVIVCFLFIVGTLAFVYLSSRDTHREDNQSSNKSSSSKNSQSKSSDPSKDTTDQVSSSESDTEAKKVPQNTDQPEPAPVDKETGKKQLQVVTSHNINADNLYIRGGINTIAYDGACYASLTGPAGQVIKKETTLLQNASTTDCKTIAIPLSELSEGDWKYSLNYISTNAEGSSGEQVAEIR